MAGCGYYSSFDIGAYILFVIKVGNSTDNLIKFTPVGTTPDITPDYAKPCPPPPATRTTHLIPDDTSNPTSTPDTPDTLDTTTPLIPDDQLIQNSTP